MVVAFFKRGCAYLSKLPYTLLIGGMVSTVTKSYDTAQKELYNVAEK